MNTEKFCNRQGAESLHCLPHGSAASSPHKHNELMTKSETDAHVDSGPNFQGKRIPSRFQDFGMERSIPSSGSVMFRFVEAPKMQ